MRIALTIAGSDSGGGAGIQADLKTFQRFGVFGTSVITAVTAQNTREVRAVHPVPVEIVLAQLDALAEDLRPPRSKPGCWVPARWCGRWPARLRGTASALRPRSGDGGHFGRPAAGRRRRT
jgi:hydroxymethylpyrimidine/phosphomethylpyrimidine kinase